MNGFEQHIGPFMELAEDRVPETKPGEYLVVVSTIIEGEPEPVIFTAIVEPDDIACKCFKHHHAEALAFASEKLFMEVRLAKAADRLLHEVDLFMEGSS